MITAATEPTSGPLPSRWLQGNQRYLQGELARIKRQLQRCLRVAAADAETVRAEAILTVAALVGGMILARATAETQPDLSTEILETLPAAIAH